MPILGIGIASAWEEDGTCVHHPRHDETCGYAAAVEGVPCTHVHDGTCGYTEAAAGSPCTHVHDETCGYTEAVEGTPCTHVHDASCGEDGAACTHVHDETCGYTEAVEGAACTHVHDGACGYAEAVEGTPCGHVHDGTCGYIEGTEGSPCRFACGLCVTGWAWDDPEGLLVPGGESGVWGLGLPNTSAESPVTGEILRELLPESVTAETAAGPRTAALAWDLGALPEEGVYEGSYTLKARLEGAYVLTGTAPALEVLLELGGGGTYAQATPFNVALNEWQWEGFDVPGKDTVLVINSDDIHSTADLAAAIRQAVPKRIYGWATGDKSVNDGAYTYAGKQAEIVVKHANPDGSDQKMPCSYGYLNVDWADIEAQISQLPDLNADFVIRAPIPTFTDRKYFVNDGNNTPNINDLPIKIRPISLSDHIVTPANPENVTVKLFDYWVADYGETPKPASKQGEPEGDILPKSDFHFHEDGDEGTLSDSSSGYSTATD